MEARRGAPNGESANAEPWQALAIARIGQIIGGRLTLERVLGVGGTASVYAARHRNGRALAVKVLHPELSRHPNIRQRFLAEGYAANKVEHADAVAILDEGEDDAGNVFIVMELLHGNTLWAQLSERGPLPIAEVVTAALGVLDVLARAHDRGVVHRDIKPSNIFKTELGIIKLLDFGIARVQDGNAQDGNGQDGNRSFPTRPGTTLGTPAFMAPELAAGKLDLLDALTDLWAVGATMFQLLTGEVVHASKSENEVIVLAATTPARSLGAVRSDLPSWLVRIVDRALSFDRRDRFPNARSMRSALASEARRAGVIADSIAPGPLVEPMATAAEMTAPIPPAVPDAAKPKRPIVMQSVMALLIACLAGGFWFALALSSRAHRESSGSSASPGNSANALSTTSLSPIASSVSVGSPNSPIANPASSAVIAPPAVSIVAIAAIDAGVPNAALANKAPRAQPRPAPGKPTSTPAPSASVSARATHPLFFPDPQE